MNYNLEEIKKKKGILNQVSINLKKKFVGLDKIIDQVIQSISVWWMMPELQTRPLTLCLWGLTGTGKTDLVRTLVKELKISDKFVEVQMDNSANSSEKIKHYLERTSIDPDDQAILLLDEMQRFRTVDGDKELQIAAYKDVWMLLSDGRFQSSSEKKMELMRILLNDLYYEDWRDDPENENEVADEESSKKKKKKNKDRTYKLGFWVASSIKSLIKTPDCIEDIMKWDQNKKTEKVMEALQNDSTFEGDKYSKLLIVISGNLDEAYHMADDVNNADVEADIFHEFSKKINLITIKNSLLKRFKPEQIARFGNNHIIYPSLSKGSYQEIIKRNVDKFIVSIEEKYSIKIGIDESIYSTIYNNGVFPSQGVRPVLSTISSTFENYLPYFVFEAIENDINKFKIYFKEDVLAANLKGKELSFNVELAIDAIKKEKSLDENTLVAIHESGHAAIYALLYGVAPVQVKSVTSMMITEGFIGMHLRSHSKKTILQDIAVTLAGRAAEEMVFGDDFKSTGAAADIYHATGIASNYVRAYGFDNTTAKIVQVTSGNSDNLNSDIEHTNEKIEKLLSEGKTRARDLLNKHKRLFKVITDELLKETQIKPSRFIEITNELSYKFKKVNADVRLIDDYDSKWKDFLKSIK